MMMMMNVMVIELTDRVACTLLIILMNDDGDDATTIAFILTIHHSHLPPSSLTDRVAWALLINDDGNGSDNYSDGDYDK